MHQVYGVVVLYQVYIIVVLLVFDSLLEELYFFLSVYPGGVGWGGGGYTTMAPSVKVGDKDYKKKTTIFLFGTVIPAVPLKVVTVFIG